jgi:hypothetical protein
VDENVFRRLESYIGQARTILFLGAGFSLDARTRADELLPTVGTITQRIWELTFPSEDYDDSSLQDVYDAALLQARSPTVELLREAFRVAPGSLPDHYRVWLSLPWHRVYTLNIDDLADAADQAFDLPRPIQSVSALTSAIQPTTDGLQVVHLNGRLDDLPNVTFGGRQYAERLAQVDVWYANIARELVGHSVVYVGTTLNEPPLWQYVEARGSRSQGPELRPGSFLVTRSLSRARQVALGQYNIAWLPGTAETFATETLSRLDGASTRGHELLRRVHSSEEQTLVDLARVVDDSTDDEREFLLGREPKWSDVGTSGFAAVRRFDTDIAERFASEHPKLMVLTGTAGSGKSSSLKRLALRLRDEGRTVAVLNEDADLRGHIIRRAVEASDVDLILIEDLERLGPGAIRVLDDVADSKPNMVVLTSTRSPRYDRLGMAAYVADRDDAVDAVVPTLTDDDIDALLDALDRANRLGVLKGKPRAEQRRVFANKCDRQLLVAMIEATSGQRFDARIESECRELSPESAFVYAVVALATVFRVRADHQLVLAAVGGDPSSQVRALNELERTHLLVRDAKNRISLRHRVIADRAVEFFRSARMVETPVRGLAFALAASVQPGNLRGTSEGQALIRLMSHDRLIEFLRSGSGAGPDVVAIRGVYQELELLLAHDHHLWLQRGSFETEAGDLDLAKNFLEQARGLAQDDPYVLTQWAYMTLKRASRRPEAPASPESVDEALSVLTEVIGTRGRRDAYPFHVYGSQGLAWVKRADLSPSDAAQFLLSLREVVDDGITLHRGARDLRQLATDLEHAYLLLAA